MKWLYNNSIVSISGHVPVAWRSVAALETRLSSMSSPRRASLRAAYIWRMYARYLLPVILSTLRASQWR